MHMKTDEYLCNQNNPDKYLWVQINVDKFKFLTILQLYY